MENIEKTPKTSTDIDENFITDSPSVLTLRMENDLLKKELNWYKEQYELSKKKQFGTSSEKMPHEDQIALFNEAEHFADETAEEPDVPEVVCHRGKQKGKREADLKDLPTERIDYTLTEEDQVCPVCESDLHEMSTQVRRELKVIPASVQVVEHISHIYSCRNCEKVGTEATIVKAEAPRAVLPKSMVSPSLLAYIMNEKFVMGTPLYRQEQSFKRNSIPISRQNMANWVIYGANTHLNHLYKRLHEELVTKEILHADETDIQVLNEEGREATQKSKMWVYVSGHTDNKSICLYEYKTTRAGKHAIAFLDGFSGYLHTDGYTGYNMVPKVTLVGCLAHVRRAFHEAQQVIKDKEALHSIKSSEGLAYCNKLFTLEKKWKDLTIEERYKKRQEEMKPLLDVYFQWLQEMKKVGLPKSKLGEAIKYTINLWPKVINILKDGRLELSNNRAERAVKPFVINRKNFLFSDTSKGAQSSAIVQSIVETAKLNNLKPLDYMTWLFEKLPNIDCNDDTQLNQLLPWSTSVPQSCNM
jgi:transposase